MTTPSLDELRAAWTGRAAGPRTAATSRRHLTALRLLADGRPVTAADIAAVTGEPVAGVRGWLARLAAVGAEVDEQGRLVGAALSLRPTRHRIRVRGNDLYAWCGFDTLFLPRLLDEPAEVASTCPVTGRSIELHLAADGTPNDVLPVTAAAAVVGPAVLEGCATAGPGSPVCAQMPLFVDTVVGQQWVAHRPGVAVVDLDTASSLARAHADRASIDHPLPLVRSARSGSRSSMTRPRDLGELPDLQRHDSGAPPRGVRSHRR